MKKIFLAITSLTLCFCLTLSASGCTSKPFLSFNSNFNGVGDNGTNHLGLKETLEYSVELVDNYNEVILKSGTISDKVVNYEFSNGKYLQTLSVQSYFPANELGITTDIPTEGNNVYRLQTKTTIDVKYNTNGNQEPYTHQDVIETDCYFLSAGQSFAPIWSKVKIDNTYLMLSDNFDKASTIMGIYEYTTVYNQKSYTMKSVAYQKSTSEPEKEVDPAIKEKTYNYEFRKLIDNNILLFALRNISIEEKQYFDIPVVSPSYGTEKTLKVTYKENSTARQEVTYNGATTLMEIPVKNYNFLISATENTGSYHYIKYQNGEVENLLPNRSLLVEYASPLISFGAFGCMGAMVYKLTSVSVEKA